ncbi:heavy metal rnd efflux outer membrane protein, czcc family [hydrocarbon metagenome]|uniref:Heavy metal rnd efflux outer membrane protein, czcc family n=1 Tax=hydrocarbon metagenome TaxID=938273 RepID=A0A0W8G0R0_9ZZZZ
MKKYLKYLISLFNYKPTQWLFVLLYGSLCPKKETSTQSFTNLTKQSLLIFFVSAITISSQSLDDYLKIAAENNPGLKSKFYSYQASLEKINQVGSLPDPQLTFGYFIEPMERYMGNQVADISIMQMFPWFGTLSAAEDEVAAMAKAKYEEFNEAKTMLFYEVKATYYSLYLLQKEISITEENIEILKTLEEIAINRLKSGETGETSGSQNSKMQQDNTTGSSGSSGMGGMNTQGQTTPSSTQRMQDMSNMNQMSRGSGMVDVLRVQIEINELKNKLALLNDSKQPLITQFNRLLNRQLYEPVNIPDTVSHSPLPASIAEMPDSIRLNNPMILMLQREEEAYIAQREMNKKMGFPMIGLGLQYSIFQQRPGSMMEAQNMIMPMLSISLPIWRGKYDGAIKEAELLHHSTGLRKEETSNQLMVSYEEALKDFKDAERRNDLYQQQTRLAQQVLDILLVQYTTAGSDFEEVLRMQQQLLDYRLRGLDAVVDQNIAAAMLERLMGR